MLACAVAFAKFCGTVDCQPLCQLLQFRTRMWCHVGAPGVAGVVVAAKKLDALVASFATTDLALVGTWMRQENTAGQVMTILVTNPQRLSWKTGLGRHITVINC